MALPTKYTKLNTIEGIGTFYNGGKGSGNFGHSGRPGEVGGSAPQGSTSSSVQDDIRKRICYSYHRKNLYKESYYLF